MKQLLILSGKGGTGKTTIAGSFIRLSGVKAYGDCDVDAPNLHLILKLASEVIKTDYWGMPKAVIDPYLCRSCGICRDNCRFEAIQCAPSYEVDINSCEGCGVCVELCPTQAIELLPFKSGDLKLYYNEDQSIFSTAQLRMGSGTTGKLVTEVKKQLTSHAPDADLAIIDGPPGIGCPVIASLSGVDMVLIVAEPSLSGINDMERIIRTAGHFKVRTIVCVNKYDINRSNTAKILSFCRKTNTPFVGKIPYDRQALSAVNNGLSISDIPCPAGEAVQSIYQKTISLLYSNRISKSERMEVYNENSSRK